MFVLQTTISNKNTASAGPVRTRCRDAGDDCFSRGMVGFRVGYVVGGGMSSLDEGWATQPETWKHLDDLVTEGLGCVQLVGNWGVVLVAAFCSVPLLQLRRAGASEVHVAWISRARHTVTPPPRSWWCHVEDLSGLV